MTGIVLHGYLGEMYGRDFPAIVRSPGEAYRALNAQIPDFARLCRDLDFTLVRILPNGEMALDEDGLFFGMDNCEYHFLPTAEMAGKKGVGKLLLGVAMIGISVFAPQIGLGALGSIGGLSVKTIGITMGISLALGGAALLLTPTPKFDTSEDNGSYLFSGDANSSGQNLPVPLVFGKTRVKVIPISTAIVTNEYKVDNTPLDNGPLSEAFRGWVNTKRIIQDGV